MANNTERYQPKLKVVHLKEIKTLLASKVKQQAIAEMFGVSQPTIAHWKRRFQNGQSINL